MEPLLYLGKRLQLSDVQLSSIKSYYYVQTDFELIIISQIN